MIPTRRSSGATGLAIRPARNRAVSPPSAVPVADRIAIRPWSMLNAQSLPAGLPALAPAIRVAVHPPLAAGEAQTPEEPGSAGGGQAPARDLIIRLLAILRTPLHILCPGAGALVWPAPLLPFQREGVATLLDRRELLLADDMGLGKTMQAIAALRILLYQGRIAHALIVCPASLLEQWRRELRRWAPDVGVVTVAGSPAERAALWRRPAPVRIVGYETLRGDVLDLRDSPVLRYHWDVVVLDEASRIKNRESGIATACRRLRRDRRWALTGTPLENRIEDVAAICEFLLGEPGKRPRLPADARGISGVLRSLQLRRRKADVLPDLPPKIVSELAVELPAGQRAAYDRAEREGVLALSAAGDAVTATHVLELITRLKQLCNRDPLTGEACKLDDVRDRIGKLVAQGHRALVFTQFIDAEYGVARIAKHLREFAPLTFTGAMSPAKRAQTVDRFVSSIRHKVMVLSLRAGGVGLNLQSASYVFHVDRWWNPAIEEQADSRAHRLGQPYPVTAFRYICADTIEERIDLRLREKRRLFGEVVDDVSLDPASALSEQELFGLFGLQMPARRTRSEVVRTPSLTPNT
jgi:SNF2 family DNA or RNA helicase